MSGSVLDNQSLQKACREVYQRFPSFKGILPRVKPYTQGRFLLVFENRAFTSNGRTLNQTVRAVIDVEGTIKKITTNR